MRKRKVEKGIKIGKEKGKTGGTTPYRCQFQKRESTQK